MKNTPRKSRSSRFCIDNAIEAFVRGFAFTRCMTYPCEAVRIGPMWGIRDTVRKSAVDYRREEWVAHGLDAADADRLARKQARGRFCVCAVRTLDEPDAPMRTGFKDAGYRLNAVEAFMVHRLITIPKISEPFPIERVLTSELADLLAKSAGRRQIIHEHLQDDAPVRQYVALDKGKPIGWAKSIVAGESTWVSNVHVDGKFRRRGIGKSIMARMLRDDRGHGAKQSVLLASHTGATLYPTVGYEHIGDLYLYTPRKK